MLSETKLNTLATIIELSNRRNDLLADIKDCEEAILQDTKELQKVESILALLIREGV